MMEKKTTKTGKLGKLVIMSQSQQFNCTQSINFLPLTLVVLWVEHFFVGRYTRPSNLSWQFGMSKINVSLSQLLGKWKYYQLVSALEMWASNSTSAIANFLPFAGENNMISARLNGCEVYSTIKRTYFNQ